MTLFDFLLHNGLIGKDTIKLDVIKKEDTKTDFEKLLTSLIKKEYKTVRSRYSFTQPFEKRKRVAKKQGLLDTTKKMQNHFIKLHRFPNISLKQIKKWTFFEKKIDQEQIQLKKNLTISLRTTEETPKQTQSIPIPKTRKSSILYKKKKVEETLSVLGEHIQTADTIIKNSNEKLEAYNSRQKGSIQQSKKSVEKLYNDTKNSRTVVSATQKEKKNTIQKDGMHHPKRNAHKTFVHHPSRQMQAVSLETHTQESKVGEPESKEQIFADMMMRTLQQKSEKKEGEWGNRIHILSSDKAESPLPIFSQNSHQDTSHNTSSQENFQQMPQEHSPEAQNFWEQVGPKQTLSLRIDRTFINVQMYANMINLNFISHHTQTLFDPNIRNVIDTIMQESGFDNYKVVLKDKKRRIDITSASIKRKVSSQRKSIDVKV